MPITTRTRAAVAIAALLATGPAHSGEPRAISPDAVLPDGGRYQGETRDGHLHGEGRIEWPHGAYYEGELVDGLAEGNGRYEFPDGSVYEGQFKNGLMHGQGTLEGPTGERHEGRFERDIVVSGEHRDALGNVYEGEFEHWRFHGDGVYRTANGDVYRGHEQGQLEGEGVHEAPSGARYEGGFRGWAYHGMGTLTQPNGMRYIGGFMSGYRHGEGRVLDADDNETRAGLWAWGDYKGPDGKADQRRAAAVEDALYRQPQLLDAALEAVAPGRAGEIELYFVGVAPYGGEDVFRKEIDFVTDQFAEHYDTRERSVVLGNHPDTLTIRPLATRTSLERSLSHVADAMDADEDVLFLYVTSHGSQDHRLSIQQPGLELPDLSAAQLSELVDDLPAKWKVIAISACYSGGFLPELADEQTLVMTAAREDRQSFGCGSGSEMTYFGDAFFREALPQADSFSAAFEQARARILEREQDQGVEEHSRPQIALGEALAQHLDAWREARNARAD